MVDALDQLSDLSPSKLIPGFGIQLHINEGPQLREPTEKLALLLRKRGFQRGSKSIQCAAAVVEVDVGKPDVIEVNAVDVVVLHDVHEHVIDMFFYRGM